MNRPLITNIQKYSIHDGDGIRTTVFFKGCPLSCTWCHNPETQSFSKQLMFQDERCTGCGACVKGCPKGAISIKDGKSVTDKTKCIECGKCIEDCLLNIREISGKYDTVNQLILEIEKDKAFYEQSKGGVTLSGGEVLAQDMDYLLELLEKLHRKGYRINIDTCGYVSYDRIKKVLPFVDTFLYDIKIMDSMLHKKYTGVDNALILDNLKKLSQDGASIWIRIPMIGGINDTVDNINQTASFLIKEKIKVKQINLLPYHNTGSSKYSRLNKTYKGEKFYTPTTKELEKLAAILHKYNFSKIQIGG